MNISRFLGSDPHTCGPAAATRGLIGWGHKAEGTHHRRAQSDRAATVHIKKDTLVCAYGVCKVFFVLRHTRVQVKLIIFLNLNLGI